MKLSLFRHHFSVIVTSCVPLIMMVSCGKENLNLNFNTISVVNSGNPTITSYYHDITDVEVLNRAWKMASVEWTPIHEVPRIKARVFPAEQKLYGIPYSSVKIMGNFVGQDVSFETFLTAAHNPKSYLYTENIALPPYNGENCGSYYGAVCSSSALFALGIEIPFQSKFVHSLPFIDNVAVQDVQSLQLCDIIATSGHTFMIYDLNYEEDTISKVTVFESTSSTIQILSYSANKFRQRWKENGYILYRPNHIVHTLPKGEHPNHSGSYLMPIDYNDDLCTAKGDKAVFSTSDSVRIDIFNLDYPYVSLYSGSMLVSKDTNPSTGEMVYKELPHGVYTAFLEDGNGNKSRPINFEVIEEHVSVDVEGSNVRISFSSSATPFYAVLTSEKGGVYVYYIMTNSDVNRGYINIKNPNMNDCHFKVVFKGLYGNISSSLMPCVTKKTGA